MLKNNVLIQYRPEFSISRNIGERIIKIPVSKMLFIETVAFKFNLQIDLIIILQIIKKNKYGFMTFFGKFCKTDDTITCALEISQNAFSKYFITFCCFFFLFSSSRKGGGFLWKYKKSFFCKRLYLNGHTFQNYYLLGVTLSFYLFLKRIHRTKQVSHFQGSTARIRKSHNFYYTTYPLYLFGVSILTMSHRLKQTLYTMFNRASFSERLLLSDRKFSRGES